MVQLACDVASCERHRLQEACVLDPGGCSKGPCKEGAIGSTIPPMGIQTKQGICIMVVWGQVF